MYRKKNIIFVKTIISVQFQGKIDTLAVPNVPNSKACAQQVKAQSSLIKLNMTIALLATLNNKPQKG
jgi:hypothetical protein